MTQKEKLLYQFLELKNQLASIEGEEVREIDTKTWRFVKAARDSKAYELRDRITMMEKSIEMAKEKAVLEAWKQTEEGKDYTTRLEDAKVKREKDYDLAFASAVARLNGLLHKHLGTNWGVREFSERHIEIGIIDPTSPADEDGCFPTLYNYNFDVYPEGYYRGEGLFKIQYSCPGAFSPENDLNRIEFLMGLAKLSSNKELQGDIRSICEIFGIAVKAAWAE